MLSRGSKVGFLLLLVAAVIFVGCSSDPINNDKIQGDPNAADFQGMKAAIASSVDSVLSTSFSFGHTPNRFPQDTLNIRLDLGIMNPLDSVLYNMVDGWHILYLGLTSGLDYNKTFVDSARFIQVGGSIEQHTSVFTMHMDYVRHVNHEYKGSNQDYQDFNIYVDFDYENWNIENKYFAGVGKVILDDYADGNHNEYNFDFTANTVEFVPDPSLPWYNIEATSGSITLDGTVTVGSTVQNWDVNATFDSNGNAVIHAVNGNTEYDYTMTPSYN